MSIIAAVLLGLLAALGATATSISTGRQRTVAVALAKQAIETLQGAAYTDVATNLSSPGLATDPLVSGTMPALSFAGEFLVAGSSVPYRTTKDEAGTTFSLRTFVTAVSPATSGSYRRITVIVDWNATGAPTIPGLHTMRFSTLVFPLDYTSYPASGGLAEAIGGAVTLTGSLAGEQFKELRLALPGTHATTDSSTLRTAIASAAGSTSTVAMLNGTVTSATCAVSGDGKSAECPRETAASLADNDTSTNTGGSGVISLQPFNAASIATLKDTTVLTPAGNMTSNATVADGSDGLPRSETSLHTTSSPSITFKVDQHLKGTLWDLTGSWSPSVTVDHDAPGGGIVNASAQLTTPQARVFNLPPGTGVPAGFDGAVRVREFTASASVTGGYPPFVDPAAAICPPGQTTCPTTATTTPVTFDIWDGSAYRTVKVTPDTPGTSLNEQATAVFTIANHSVKFTSYVQSQPATSSKTADTPRSRSVAQIPSLLLVTVVVEVTTTTVAESTTTTVAESTTTTVAESTTTTLAPVASVETFKIVFDYGRVSAGATWLVEPP